MSRCDKCRYSHDYPMSCKDSNLEFPFCGFKRKTKLQIEIERKLRDYKKDKAER